MLSEMRNARLLTPRPVAASVDELLDRRHRAPAVLAQRFEVTALASSG